MMLHSERYCGGNTLGDQWAERINGFIQGWSGNRWIRPGEKILIILRSSFIPGWFSWSNTLEFGSHVRAHQMAVSMGKPLNHAQILPLVLEGMGR